MMLADFLCIAFVNLVFPNADIACEHMYYVVDMAEIEKVDPFVVTSLIHVESRWTPEAVSRSGACGLTQVLPRFSGGYRNRFGKRLSCKELQEPLTSIERGTAILAFYVKRYRGNYRRALCAYNAGPARCTPGRKRHKGHRYADRVLSITRKLKRGTKRARREHKERPYIPGCYE
jgi:soluble lytic murein transglycosylase-like protein